MRGAPGAGRARGRRPPPPPRRRSNAAAAPSRRRRRRHRGTGARSPFRSRRRRGEWPRRGTGAFGPRRCSYRALWSAGAVAGSRRWARRRRAGRDGARRWGFAGAGPPFARVALPGRLELRVQYVELLEKCRIRLRLRSPLARARARPRGRALVFAQMSNNKRRRPKRPDCSGPARRRGAVSRR